ncbi:hypothetical protein IC762_17760 [Bradyrhizobium genosp. L]|uniref:hypothetical protein n=1 Tax=Bradyrhizobium genosp. L TaxID=83637 RepID=UPI0018A2F773|nr:hypothetical protein [Bradyrhizobium genosp. L]QPF81671.1 hypothetical protein IC762_17760 [Bradyrhizobium genosp. L]
MIVDTLKIRRSEVMQSLTLRVRAQGFGRAFRVRVWIATRLISLAGKILGCRMDIEIK